MSNILDYKKFILYEYFPQELPKTFNIKNFANNYTTILNKAKASNEKSSEPFLFTVYKNEKSRRLLSIPNPYHYIKLVDVIIQNEAELFKLFNKSNYSLTKPSNKQNKNDKLAFSRITNSVQETRFFNEKLYKGHNYCLKLDINSFFDSIYTHTISWVLHGKEYAKLHRTDNQLLGNKIDCAIRNLNREQTNGILVGNACSRIVSEIILCNLDNIIAKKFNNIDVCRYVDDYLIYFTNDISKISTNETEILEFIRLNLLEYGLQLNESKIIVTKAPFTSGKKEIEELRSIVTNDAHIYLNNLLHIFNKVKDISVLKYGLKVVNYKITEENFKSIQPLLMNIWCNNPSITEEILNIILNYKHHIKKNEFKKDIINKIFLRCIHYRKDIELVWLLYACKQLDISLNSKEIDMVFQTENDLAIITVLDMNKTNQTKLYAENLKKLESRLTQINNIFYSNKWLLAYEIIKNNYIPTFNPNFTQQNDFFKKLIELNVEFYDGNYQHESIEKKEKNDEFITREEFKKMINEIYLLINKDNKDKKDINVVINNLNQKLEDYFDNKYI